MTELPVAVYLYHVYLPVGGEADRPAATDHCLRSFRLRSRPCAVPVPQQPAEVHRDLRPEGDKKHASNFCIVCTARVVWLCGAGS